MAALLASLAIAGADAPAAVAPASPAEFRLVHPETQLRRVLELFRNARARNPAMALVAWKLAGRSMTPPWSLGKAREAAIAAINPDMIDEVSHLDAARFILEPQPETLPRWRLAVPQDDGTLGAFMDAMTFSIGAAQPPLQDVPVNRVGLGPLILAARPVDRGLVVATTRDDLALTLFGPTPDVQGWPKVDSGVLARFDVQALARGLDGGSVPRRQVSHTLATLKARSLTAVAHLADGAARLDLRLTLSEGTPAPTCTLDLAWLDLIPSRASAVATLAVNPTADGLASLFALIDAAEKADPARSGVAPARTRLNILTMLARVNLDADLWPLLRGLTVGAMDERLNPDRPAIFALIHLDSEASAARVLDRVVLRIAPRLLRSGRPAPFVEGSVVALGLADGQPVEASRKGSTVVIGLGRGVAALALDSAARPSGSATAELKVAYAKHGTPARAGWARPGRFPGLAIPPRSPLAAALEAAGPLLWIGRDEPDALHDELTWPALKPAIEAFLARLPMEFPTDRGRLGRGAAAAAVETKP
ncbi:hypothetical protein EP7_000535 [Isosphaeraceae bacterium EP7]